jgi:hypothetical protein
MGRGAKLLVFLGCLLLLALAANLLMILAGIHILVARNLSEDTVKITPIILDKPAPPYVLKPGNLVVRVMQVADTSGSLSLNCASLGSAAMNDYGIDYVTANTSAIYLVDLDGCGGNKKLRTVYVLLGHWISISTS